MRAIQISDITSPQDLTLTEIPDPVPTPGWVLIKVMARGLNHSELVLMEGEIQAPYIQKPVVPGIECVGTVVDGGGSDFRPGEHVLALMGGMGRSFNGSWAEYTLVPAEHVFHVPSDWSFVELAALGETYFTAWGALTECLHMKDGESLLIRGASSSLGYAALQLARAAGLTVTCTVRKEKHVPALEADGAHDVIANNAEPLSETGRYWNKALELVGPATLADTLGCMYAGGIVCSAGILGGSSSMTLDPIKDIPNGVYLTGYFSNYPTQHKINALLDFMREHHLKPGVAAVYPLDRIAEAWTGRITGAVSGKIVISE